MSVGVKAVVLGVRSCGQGYRSGMGSTEEWGVDLELARTSRGNVEEWASCGDRCSKDKS